MENDMPEFVGRSESSARRGGTALGTRTSETKEESKSITSLCAFRS